MSSDSSRTRVAGDDGEILDESGRERFEFTH